MEEEELKQIDYVDSWPEFVSRTSKETERLWCEYKISKHKDEVKHYKRILKELNKKEVIKNGRTNKRK